MLIPRKMTLVLSEHSNTTEGIVNFRAKGIKYFKSLKMKWKFPYVYPTVGQMEGALTSSVIIILWMHITVTNVSKNMSLKLSGRRPFL